MPEKRSRVWDDVEELVKKQKHFVDAGNDRSNETVLRRPPIYIDLTSDDEEPRSLTDERDELQRLTNKCDEPRHEVTPGAAYDTCFGLVHPTIRSYSVQSLDPKRKTDIS